MIWNGNRPVMRASSTRPVRARHLGSANACDAKLRRIATSATTSALRSRSRRAWKNLMYGASSSEAGCVSPGLTTILPYSNQQMQPRQSRLKAMDSAGLDGVGRVGEGDVVHQPGKLVRPDSCVQLAFEVAGFSPLIPEGLAALQKPTMIDGCTNGLAPDRRGCTP